MTMGIPGSGATAIILAAFLLHGIQPGPQVFVSSTALIYTVFASVFVGVVGMCILGYFAIKPLCKVLDAPEALVSAFVVMFCFIGAFAARNNLSDLYVIVAFGVIGFLFERFKFPIAPLVLGTILGPLAESDFMTTMISFNNDWTVFFTRPISGTILALAIIGLGFRSLRTMRETPARQRERTSNGMSLDERPRVDRSRGFSRGRRRRAGRARARGAGDRRALRPGTRRRARRRRRLGDHRAGAQPRARRARRADTGLGNVDDKISKNHRKTLGLLRDLQGAQSVGVIAEYPERGIDRDRPRRSASSPPSRPRPTRPRRPPTTSSTR